MMVVRQQNWMTSSSRRLSFAVFVAWSVGVSSCPINTETNAICSGHGHCAKRSEIVPNDAFGGGATFTQEMCVCDQGFTGGDCSQRVCPAGRSWVDYAQANNTAHADHVECSNHGYCDRTAGKCDCRYGFGGHACERMLCPIVRDLIGRKRECGGQGRCVSMGEAAREIDYSALVRDTVYEGWDADMIYGCACDEGFTGWDCSERVCARGHDPMVAAGVDETQLLECYCQYGCNGTLSLTYKGQRTDPIPYDATPELLKYRLEQLSTVTEVEVVYHGTDPMMSLCTNLPPGTTAAITFTLGQRGDLPSLNVSSDDLKMTTLSVAVNGELGTLNSGVASVRGTKLDEECSRRGSCDRTSGSCTCYNGFEMSDGKNGQGSRFPDCGYFTANVSDFFYGKLDNAGEVEGPCPRAYPQWDTNNDGKLICSGVGDCQLDKTCNCTLGYEGPACEYMTCPENNAWFDEAQEAGDAHASATCSNRGSCDRTTGECNCDASYGLMEGDDCNKMKCYENNSLSCGLFGTCQSIAFLATESEVFDSTGDRLRVNYSDAWDSEMIHGCACTAAAGQWPVALGDYSYRGPYAYGFTKQTGYTCGHAYCPTGDNPFTYGVNEVQTINCTAYSGTFTITFRDAEPVIVPYSSTASEFEILISTLSTIRNVTVTYSGNGTRAALSKNVSTLTPSICEGDGTNVTIEFVSERGDVPLMLLDGGGLNTFSQPIVIAETTKGTKENLECAGFGICNRQIGQCECLDGFYSGGDDVPFRVTGVRGHRGDCSFRHSNTGHEPRWHNSDFEYEYTFVIPEVDEV